jgi:NitT/TauT family transport system substrate-binding protein
MKTRFPVSPIIQKPWAIVLVLSLVLSACTTTATPTPSLTSITIQLSFTNQAQFAGFYAADQNGDYAAEGLAVTFLEGGPQVDLLTPVLDHTAQFGIANADALLIARAHGKPLRAIATIYRRSPAVFMALASSGIARPQDFVGKTIQIGQRGIPLLHAMLARAGVRPDQYSTVDPTPDLTPFYSGTVDVRSVFLTNEVVTARAAGYKVNIIYPDDYGVHFYGDTLFATDDSIAGNPDLVRRFLRATLKGWTYAVENPTAVGPLVRKYKPAADIAHETALMTASLPLINTGQDHIGWMKPDFWAGMEQTLRAQGVLTQTMGVTQTYTLQFLQEIYGP